MLGFAQNLLWRAYQIVLFIIAMLSFRAASATSEKYWFFQIVAMFLFAFCFSLYATKLTVLAIDHLKTLCGNKGFNEFSPKISGRLAFRQLGDKILRIFPFKGKSFRKRL